MEYAELYFHICKEIRVKLDNKHWYQNQLKQAMRVKLPYCETKMCKLTELFLAIKQTS